jgi:hypothetical protein
LLNSFERFVLVLVSEVVDREIVGDVGDAVVVGGDVVVVVYCCCTFAIKLKNSLYLVSTLFAQAAILGP